MPDHCKPGTDSSPSCCSFPPGQAVFALSSVQPLQLLQATVQFPFALLASPGSAFGAEPFQVFFKVLMVHGAIALWLAETLGKEKLFSLCLSHRSDGLVETL